MVSAPFFACRLNCRVGGALHLMREDLDDEVLAASSRSQKGRRCKLDGSVDPQPPNPTGSVACDQVEAPSKLMLKTALTLEWSSSSKLSRQGEEKHGAVLKMYNILGMAKEWQSKMRASCFRKCGNLCPMIFRASTLLVMAASIEVASPIGDPRRMALYILHIIIIE